MIRLLVLLVGVAPQETGQEEKLQKHIPGWIEQLGAEDVEVREKAQRALTAAGKEAIPHLRRAAESTNAEVKVRARRALDAILWAIERQPIEIFLDAEKKVKMTFVRIPAGKFTMGDRDLMDATPHEVTLSKDYWMQTTETTQAQWEAVMGENPSLIRGADLPVEHLSWDNCRKFLKKLNEEAKDQLKGRWARLPTEAEWEHACRAGSTGKYCFGNGETKLGEYAWYEENSENKIHPVGRKKANAWGLYDMHGNVWEWCEDWYGEYPSEAVTDPTGPAKGDTWCMRGGCGGSGSRCHGRGGTDKAGLYRSVGLRVALSLFP